MRTKQDLLDEIEKLKEKVERLENDVDYWMDEYDYMEAERDELDKELSKYNGGIINVDNFIWKLKVDNMYTDELEQWIRQYMKYYNE